jgi:hypothetical protein
MYNGRELKLRHSKSGKKDVKGQGGARCLVRYRFSPSPPRLATVCICNGQLSLEISCGKWKIIVALCFYVEAGVSHG